MFHVEHQQTINNLLTVNYLWEYKNPQFEKIITFINLFIQTFNP